MHSFHKSNIEQFADKKILIQLFHFQISGAVLVWAENANIAKRWSDPNGIPILTEWHDAVYKYDNAMIANQTMDALGNFYIISACLKLAQPHIRNYQCRQWFAETTVGSELFSRNFGIFHFFLRTTFASKCCALANAFENKKLQNRVKNIFNDTFFGIDWEFWNHSVSRAAVTVPVKLNISTKNLAKQTMGFGLHSFHSFR